MNGYKLYYGFNQILIGDRDTHIKFQTFNEKSNYQQILPYDKRALDQILPSCVVISWNFPCGQALFTEK